MITRLYVNNYRCLVAFETRFETFGVLCGPNGSGKSSVFDAVRVLSALAVGAAHTVLIDEPDNFIGLPELHPWALSLLETLGGETQALIISHHPEILNTAGEQSSRYLWRDSHTSPTRISSLRPVEGLSVGEVIARGWINV